MNRRLRLCASRDARITPEEMDVDTKALAFYRAATARQAVKNALAAAGIAEPVAAMRKPSYTGRTLTRFAEELIAFFNAGSDETELRQAEVFVGALIDDLYVGREAPSLEQLDQAETAVECEENTLTTKRYTQPDAWGDAEDLRAAEVDERAAAISKARARALRRRHRERVRQREEMLRRLNYAEPLRRA